LAKAEADAAKIKADGSSTMLRHHLRHAVSAQRIGDNQAVALAANCRPSRPEYLRRSKSSLALMP
jgi:hypothetical protein